MTHWNLRCVVYSDTPLELNGARRSVAWRKKHSVNPPLGQLLQGNSKVFPGASWVFLLVSSQWDVPVIAFSVFLLVFLIPLVSNWSPKKNIECKKHAAISHYIFFNTLFNLTELEKEKCNESLLIILAEVFEHPGSPICYHSVLKGTSNFSI